MLPDAGDDCARLSACSSLAIPYLPDAGGDSAQPHEVARQDRRRWRHALKLLWDMRRFAPSVMGPAAPATGFAPSVMGPTLASSSAAPATGLAAPPSHRLLSAIIGQRPRGVTAPGHRPLSVAIGHRPASSLIARATRLAALPTTGPSALSSAVYSSCKDFAWEASCPSRVTGTGKKKPWEKESSARRRQTTPCGVWECCF